MLNENRLQRILETLHNIAIQIKQLIDTIEHAIKHDNR